MSLLTRKEVAALTNRTVQAIGNSIKRGHLIEENKRINTDLRKNKLFLSKFITRSIKTDENGSISNLDRLLKEHDLQLKKVKIKTQNLELSKKQNKLIELDASREILNRAVIILSSQYRNTSKQYLTEIAAKYAIPDIDIAEIQKNFDKTINDSVKASKDLILQECKVMAESL